MKKKEISACRQAKAYKDKYIYIEIMRILAVFFVIFNHTGSDGFFLFAHRQVNSIPFWLYMVPSIFCRLSVPLFLIISGALFLERENETLKELWGKRILKMAGILLAWSFVYYIYDTIHMSGKIDILTALKQIYTDHAKFHLWYLYIYIAFLVSLPFLRAMVQKLETKYFYYMIGLAVFLNGILPVAEYLMGQGSMVLNSDLKISWLLMDIVLYPSLGYFLQTRVDYSRMNRKLALIWIGAAAGMILCCYMTCYRADVINSLAEGESQVFHQSFVIVNCIAVFCTVRVVCEKRNISGRLKTVIMSLGKAAFGIYLMHILVMESGWMDRVLHMLWATGLNDMICVLIYCLFVMAVCYGITLVMSKIPVLKKTVGY